MAGRCWSKAASTRSPSTSPGTSASPPAAPALPPPRHRTRPGARRPGGPLLLAYDNDPAGQTATVRAGDLLAGLDARVVELPTGMDPADVLVATGFRGLRRALAERVPLVDAAITTRLQRWAAHTGKPVALVDAVREVTPLVTGVPPADRARLVSLITGRLDLPVDRAKSIMLSSSPTVARAMTTAANHPVMEPVSQPTT